MRVRKLSPTGDMTWGSGILNFWVDVPDGVGQKVQTSLLLWLGEFYLDVTVGMPWIQGVLGYHSQDTADAIVQDYVLNIDNVTGIENFVSQSNQAVRSYTASFLLDTIYGKTTVQVANQTLF